jgi:hypothetical protein
MDLNTEEGIQNFRASLHLAFKEHIRNHELQIYRKPSGSFDVERAVNSKIDEIGISVLKNMKRLHTHTNIPSSLNSQISQKKDHGYFSQIINDDYDDE